MEYAELQTTSNFSFLHGAAHPQELVACAAALGHRAVAITDHNSVAGIVRGHMAAKQAGIPYIVGARLDFCDGGPSALCLPTDRAAYARLTQLLTLGRRRAEKGACELGWDDLDTYAEGQSLIVLPPDDGVPDQAFADHLAEVAGRYSGRVYLAASCRYRGADADRLAALDALGAAAGAPMVATNDVRYHLPDRRPLADVLTCIREHCTIDEAGLRAAVNAERYLKPPGRAYR